MTAAQTPKPHRTLQIHVTRKCNLKCLHCYSSSGPEYSEALDLEHLKEAVTDAYALGFTFATLSGGEPFLYPHMVPLLEHAKGLGMRTGTVTNGMFLDERRLEQLKGALDLVVISLDGAPERHNRMRANASAFEVMAQKLPALQQSGIPFGFLFTLSRDNAHELDWAADFAAESGASMLQVHPLDLDLGRAAETGALDGLDPDESAAIYAGQRALNAKKRIGDKMKIVVDFRPRLPEGQRPQVVACDQKPSFADLVNTLCIETDGSITPMGHGFSRDYKLGQLGHGRLMDQAKAWAASGTASRYAKLVQDVRDAADAANAPLVQNMAQTLRRAAQQEGAMIAAE